MQDTNDDNEYGHFIDTDVVEWPPENKPFMVSKSKMVYNNARYNSSMMVYDNGNDKSLDLYIKPSNSVIIMIFVNVVSIIGITLLCIQLYKQ